MISDINYSFKLFISFLFLYSLRNVKANDCDDGWYQYRSKCYKIHYESVKYIESVDKCDRLESHPITFHSADEINFITEIIPNQMFWMGAKRNQSDTNSLIWTDHSEWDFERWAYSHPHNEDDCFCGVEGYFISCNCESSAITVCQKWTKIHTVSAIISTLEKSIFTHMSQIEQNIEHRIVSLSEEFEARFNALYNLMTEVLNDESNPKIDKSLNHICENRENCDHKQTVVTSIKGNKNDRKVAPIAGNLIIMPHLKTNMSNISNSEVNITALNVNSNSSSEASKNFNSTSYDYQKFALNELFTSFPILSQSSISEEKVTETDSVITLMDESMETQYDLSINTSDELTSEVGSRTEYPIFLDSEGDAHQQTQESREESSYVTEVNTESEVTTEISSTISMEIELTSLNESVTLDEGEIKESIHKPMIKKDVKKSGELRSSFMELKVGEIYTQKVPSFGDWNLKLAQEKPTLLKFNYKLPLGVTAGVYGGKNRVPTYTKYDFMRVVGETQISSRKARSHRNNNEMQNVEFTQYLDSGNWYITVYNDESEAQEITFVTIITNNSQIECQGDCNGHGFCINGRCDCEHGYFGNSCEYKMCPVLCSNHGKYVKGQCLCDSGWNGVECELRTEQCGNCSGNGVCVDGVCNCFDGYNGKQCDQRAITATADFELNDAVSLKLAKICLQNCSGNGICVNGDCNCFLGYKGELCEKKIENCSYSCGENGHCEASECVCSQGWSGIKCDERLCDPRCLEHGLCNNGTCICSQGWNGIYCSLEGCPKNCSNRGECEQIDDDWICDCFDGWSGKGCIVPLEQQCNDDFDNDYDGLIDCADSECCESKYCENNPLCFSSKEPTDVLLRKQPPSATTPFFKRISFLIEENSVQKYAMWESFDERRASVVRGRVENQYGYGLRGVRVGVDNEPFLGFTLTREQGWFDILVNGGGAVTLNFLRDPFQPLHVTINVPWNEFVIVDEITMHVDKRKLMEQSSAMCVDHNYEVMRPVVINNWRPELQNFCKRNEFDSILKPLVLLETIPITSTNFGLVYHSSRSQGFTSMLELQLTPDYVPSTLTRVYLKISVAGNIVQKLFEGSANIKYTYFWNRHNIYKQKVYGIVAAKIQVGYEYSDCSEIIWEVREVNMKGHDLKISEIGDWNLNIHHRLNTIDWIVHKGDGSNLYLQNRPKKVKVVMGFGEQRPIQCPHCNGETEYQSLLAPIALASAPDGSLYVGDFNLVRRITKDGYVSTVIELTSAQLAYKYYLTVSPFDGKLYISDHEKFQILRAIISSETVFNPRNNLEVVVGSGIKCLPGTRNNCGDGRQARDARLAFPKGIAITLRNEIFIADAANIRMVDSNGIIHTLIGDHYHKNPWKPFPCAKAFPLHEMTLRWPTELAINPIDNSLHILDDNLVLRLTPDKRIQIVAGKQPQCLVPKLPKSGEQMATETFLETPKSIAFSKSGDLFIAESDSHTINRIQKVNMDGEMTRFAGADLNCSCSQLNCECFDEDDSIALNAKFHTISAITVTEDGLLYICDQGNVRIRSVIPSRPSLNENQEFEVKHKNETYLFNRFGLHVATKSTVSGQIRYQFAYTDKTSAGKLSSITDEKRNRIYLLRDHRKQAISIESSLFGHCKLSFTRNKYLKSFEAPHMNKITLSYYESSSLLKTLSDSNENVITFNYNESGRFMSAITSKGEDVRFNVSSIYDKLCEEIADEANQFI